MKRRVFYKVMAYVLLLTLLFPAMGSTHAAHASEVQDDVLFLVSEEELAEEKVLVLTEDEADKNGNIVVAGGTWERVIIRRCNQEVKKIYLQGMEAEMLIVEGGMESEITISDSHIIEMYVTAPQTGGISFAEFYELAESGVVVSDYIPLLLTYYEVMRDTTELRPTVITKGTTEIHDVHALTNVVLKLYDGAVEKVEIETKDTYSSMHVDVLGYDGAVFVEQNRAESEGTSYLGLKVKNSNLQSLEVKGESGSCHVEGDDATIALMKVSGTYGVVTSVNTKEIVLDETAKNASVRIYSEVERIDVQGNNNRVILSASADVETVTVEGDNTKVYGWGDLENAVVSGGNAQVAVPGATVTGEHDSTIPDEMYDMIQTPTKPSTPSTPSTPEEPDEPVVPDTPQEPDEGIHVHTWNIEEANCVTNKYCEECGFVGETATGIHSLVEGNVTEPSCTTNGYTTYFCEYCDASEIRDLTPVTKHTVTTWVNGNLVDGKTCEYTQVGVCSGCGEQMVSDATIVIHNANFVVTVTKEATCVQAGEKTFTCPDCGVVVTTESYENEEAHNWDAGQEIEGEIVYTCEHCAKTKTVVAMTSAGITTNELTDSTEVRVSSGSSATVAMTLDTATLSQIQGAGSDTTVKLSADTLSAEDKEAVVESLDEELKEQLGDSEIFDFSMVVGDEKVTNFNGKITVRLPYTLGKGEDPSAIVVWYIADNGEIEKISDAVYFDGYVTFETNHFSYYTVVKMSSSEKCNLYGHLWVDLSIAPTCTTDGQSRKVCQRCASEVEGAMVEATGHDLARETLKESTCAENGTYRQYCTKCNYSQEGRLPRAPHDTTITEQVDATCTESGYISYVCVCGYEKTDVLYATGHDAGADGCCTNCGLMVGCQHSEIEVVAELAPGAETCEDGVIAKLTCVYCGEVINQWTEDFHGTPYKVYDKVDLEDYAPGCASYIERGICLCGQVISDWSMSYGNFDNWIMDENYYDSDHYTGEYTYADSGLTVVQNWEYNQVKGCEYEYYREYLVYLNGVLKGTYSSTGEYARHWYTARHELAEGSQNCEDGLLVINYCENCGEEFDSFLVNRHITWERVIDLSEYSTCGDFIRMYACPCNEVVEDIWLYVECSSGGWTEYTDDDGIEHKVNTTDCTSCDLTAVLDRATVAMDGCVATFDYSFKVDLAGEEIYRLDYTKTEDLHMWETSYSFVEGAVDCEDGVIEARYCSACGLVEDSYVMDWHAYTQEKTIYMSDYGEACGLYFEYASCLCGKEYYYFIQEYGTCQLYATGNIYVDEDGVPHYLTTYACSQCPTSFTEDLVDVQTGPCEGMNKKEYVFYYAGEEVGSFKVTEPYERHDTYVASATLLPGGTSCEDGIEVVHKCRNCDYTECGTRDWHTMQVISSINLEEYGCTCGGYIEFLECPCGAEERESIEFLCDTGVDWYGMIYGDFELVEETDAYSLYRQEYVCKDCNLVITVEERCTKIDACNEKCTLYFCIGSDGDYEVEIAVAEYTLETHIRQEEDAYGTENGVPVKIITYSCEVCGGDRRVDTYADYLGDGSYYYKIRQESANGTVFEYHYTFDDSGCSMILSFTMPDGSYYENEPENACVIVGGWVQEASCTQYAIGICSMCNSERVSLSWPPSGHCFVENTDGNGYYCETCGLESDVDTNAGIIMEDLSDDTNYKAGYNNRSYGLGVFSLYVMISADGAEHIVDVPTDTYEEYQSGIITISRADIAACVGELGISGSYTVTLSIVDEFGDGFFSLTFGE